MVPHVNLMICGGWVSAPLNKGCPASLLTNEAASRPYSSDAAVWLAFVAERFWLPSMLRPLATVALFQRLRV